MELSINKSTSFSDEDIKEKYINLKNQHDGFLKKYESLQQELHDTKRNHNTAMELKEHLYSEIEAMQKAEKNIRTECNVKCKHLQEELENLREEKWKETENNMSVIESLKENIKQLKSEKVERDNVNNISFNNTKLLDDLRNYEEEISSLKQDNLNLKTSLEKCVSANEMQKVEMQSLNERIECMESNLNNKKQEIESIGEMLHSTQEELCMVNMELQQYKSSSNTIAPKGNSLFAEVDDKRQEMLKTLTQMKDKICQLNRELSSKQAEVDALMCEKKSLWEEYSGQTQNEATLFRAYERRITDLEKQNYQLNRDIARWFDKHIDPQSSEAAQWVSGVLDHYKKENSKLSSELMAASVNNLSAEQKLRDSQKQIVTWRTKALQSNASVIDLETKLQSLEKSVMIVNSTNIESPQQVKVANDINLSNKDDNALCVTPKDGFNDVDISAIKQINESIKMKENQTPNIQGILSVGGGDVKKISKTTTFKQE